MPGVRRASVRVARAVTRRARTLLGLYLVVILGTGAQLVSIQLVNADEYADRGVRQRERVIELSASRGRIYDRDGDVLATSVAAATIYADPREFRAPGERRQGPDDERLTTLEAAYLLADVVDVPADTVAERLGRDAHFVYLARQRDWEVGLEVSGLGLRGVGVLTEPRRVYPMGTLASQIVGFTDIDGVGLQGLEVLYDGVLQGEPGRLAIERTPSGLDISSGTRELLPARPGKDLVLTVDRDIQHVAERAALDATEAHGARGAGVVVLDVETFEVLAMASTPGFDPNVRREEDRASWQNRSVTEVFEPGSAQKALTIAAAIEEGVVGPHTRFSVPDRIRVSTHTFSDIEPRETLDLSVTEIIERSSNVGTIQIARALGEEPLDRYLRAFGYGASTGLGFPGESAGLLMPHEQWWGTSLPTIAIGQGVAVTLAQLATAYAVLGNRGVALAPRIVRGTVGGDGTMEPVASDPGVQVVSPSTAAAVRDMLVEAVEGDHATGGLARVPGYSVGGKTGTARKPASGAAGYSDEYVATFVGFAPADSPRLVVAVMVDEPTPIYGGVVAAPVFSQVMEAALTARRVPPDRDDRSLAELLGDARERALQAAQREGPATHSDDAAAHVPEG